ncbi:MAG: serine/threonine-protein kinase [Pirellulales bacterium]
MDDSRTQIWNQTPLPAPSSLPDQDAGQLGLLGDYELLELVARGGMGVVYKARHRRLNRLVALKMILSGRLASPDDVRRFTTEAAAAARLDHPGIVPVYEAGEIGGLHFISMAFVEGPTLAARLAAGPLSFADAIAWLRQIAAAVAYAHAQGIVHRDLKPANILLNASPTAASSDASSQSKFVDETTEYVVPKVTDFGLAKQLDGQDSVTSTGQIVGTPAFMSPEQAAGKSTEVRESSDLYALGAILYAMLTGRAPFQADSPLDVILQVLEQDPTPPRELRRDVPRELQAICLKCLEKDPADRYSSVLELIEDLRRYEHEEGVEACRAGVGRRVQRWLRRRPSLSAHLIACAAVLAILNVRFAWYYTAISKPFHLQVCELLCVWAGASFMCQLLLDRTATREWGRYVWAAVDVGLMTGMLWISQPPRGLILAGYPLLIVASGLFARVPLVAFTTGVSMAAFVGLLLNTPDELQPTIYAFLYETMLLLIGSIVAYQVQRIRTLSRHLERHGGFAD